SPSPIYEFGLGIEAGCGSSRSDPCLCPSRSSMFGVEFRLGWSRVRGLEWGSRVGLRPTLGFGVGLGRVFVGSLSGSLGRGWVPNQRHQNLSFVQAQRSDPDPNLGSQSTVPFTFLGVLVGPRVHVQ
uniref:Uncharacterized protein n=1 Tax=Cannabis sativa TaxID=3483 RepID=A0A803QRX7_CANSA